MIWPSADVVELLLPGGAVPVRYVGVDDSVWLVASDERATWPVEVLRKGAVELRTSTGSTRMGVSLVVGRTARAEVLDRFRSRYGPDAVGRWFPRPGRMGRLDANG